ncbi:MAG: hypothetical protein QM706_03205 [Nitrospira sp.]
MAQPAPQSRIGKNVSFIPGLLKRQFPDCPSMVLFLWLLTMFQVPDVALASGGMNRSPCDILPGHNALRAEQEVERDTHIISGELIGADGDYYIVKDEKGNEVSVLSDKRTDKPVIVKGDRITAYVDSENYALWIRSNESTDHRSEHASVDCSPN